MNQVGSPLSRGAAPVVRRQEEHVRSRTERRVSGRSDTHLLARRVLLKSRRGGRVRAVRSPGRRGTGFSQVETTNLLGLLLEHLPLARGNGKIARLHELRYPAQQRNADSLRRNFAALCCTVPPTGYASIPPEVLKAKEVKQALIERPDIGDGAGSDDDYTDSFNDGLHSTVPRIPTESGESEGEGASVVPGSNAVVCSAAGSEGACHTESTLLPSPCPLVRKRAGSQSSRTPDDIESLRSTINVSMTQ